jgi:hypothetical protein
MEKSKNTIACRPYFNYLVPNQTSKFNYLCRELTKYRETRTKKRAKQVSFYILNVKTLGTYVLHTESTQRNSQVHWEATLYLQMSLLEQSSSLMLFFHCPQFWILQ